VIVEGRPCCFSSNFVGREREIEIETDLVGRESFCFWILSGEFCLLDSVPFAFEKMKWFDKLFKRSGSSPDDDNGEAGVHVHGHHFSHNGPHLFSVWNLELLLFFFLVPFVALSFAGLDLYRIPANGFRSVC
jgi:hypothetical protein